EPARTATELCEPRRSRSDRRDDPDHRSRSGNGLSARPGGSAVTDQALTIARARRPAEPWRQRLIRSLLYGRNVDRAAKARARVGFAVLAFALVYTVLAGRLVMFAVGSDSHGARRTASQDAIATARPDIVDRNGEVLATDVKVAHLIGLVNIDNQGIAGMEKWLDNNGLADLHRAGFATDRLQKPVELSVDLRVEHALRDELMKAKEKFKAKAASGLIANV